MSFLASHAGLIGLLFFFVFFLGVLAWAFRPGSKEYFKKFGRIPLEEKDND